ncbi:MAG: hypothetical protein H6622_04740 [Halobacteriovoraceae bacterium]|nr:hypothetical protein [Halobacteriovoraceae bacterium]
MIQAKFSYIQKKIKAKKVFYIKDKEFHYLESLFIKIEIENNVFCSECTPIDLIHFNSINECEILLKSFCEHDHKIKHTDFNLFAPFFNLIKQEKLPPPLQTGIEHLLLQFIHSKGKVISNNHEFLGDYYPTSNKNIMSSLQNLIFVTDTETSLAEVRDLISEGATYFKLKLGYQKEVEDLNFLKSLFLLPDKKIVRIDCNEKIKNEFISKCHEYINFIDYFEDPPTHSGLDESKKAWDTPALLNKTPFSEKNTLVIKPTLFSGISHVFNFIDEHLHNPIVLSSCYEVGPFHSFYNFLFNINKLNMKQGHGIGTVKYIQDVK